MAYNVAIDGPAGAGKSTIARRAAQRLHYLYIDTGAMYRAMAVFFVDKGLDITDEKSISDSCSDINISIDYDDEGNQRVFLDGVDVTGRLRDQKTGDTASVTSAYKTVRTKLVEIQRDLASRTNVIMDGRDIGSVVLPDADVKIYLTASVEVRAKRRFDELTAKGEKCDLQEISREIEERDYRDMHRAVSPLTLVDDAVLIDSSDMSIDEVTDTIVKLVNEKVSKN